MSLKVLDKDALRASFLSATPFPSLCIEELFEPDFLRDVARSYPGFEDAARMGKVFNALNEKLKVQITEPERFPAPVRRLADILLGREFLSTLEYITGIPRLLVDPTYQGGGMHITANTGRLDVHVDFNRLDDLYRRINLLLYLNEGWSPSWGGNIELWNAEVTRCERSYSPEFGRCVLFATSERSYHGVCPIRCPDGVVRKSFALYYYTREAPSEIVGEHSTIFRARPEERMRKYVLMPMHQLRARVRQGIHTTKQAAKRVLGRN